MEGGAGLPELVEGLVSHMHRTRRLYLVLMLTAFLMAPAALILAFVILSPGITLAGPEYSFIVDYDELPRDLYTEHEDEFLLEEGIYGEFEGHMEGRLLGEHHILPSNGHANTIVYTGEFVGEFDGKYGVFIGDFVGTFEGDFAGLYGDEDPYGLYDGLFEGVFVGFFADEVDGPEIVIYNDELVPAYADPRHAVGFVAEDPVGYPELIPRFMVIDDGTVPNIQTDITIPVVAMVVLVAAVSGVVLYVGLRELSFYAGWSSRLDRYMERKRKIDEELADNTDNS